jgi:hypothetical protein
VFAVDNEAPRDGGNRPGPGHHTKEETMAKKTIHHTADDPRHDIGYRLSRLSTNVDGVATALMKFCSGDRLSDQAEERSMLVMLEETLRIWADEAEQIHDDVMKGWTPKKAVA